MSKLNKKNFKKIILWTAIASLISMISNNYNLFEIIQMPEETYNMIVEKILYILVLAGILTNQDKVG